MNKHFSPLGMIRTPLLKQWKENPSEIVQLRSISVLQYKQSCWTPYRPASQVHISLLFAFQSTVSLWQNAEQREFYQRLIETVAVLHRLTNRLSSRAEMVGAVRQVSVRPLCAVTPQGINSSSLFCLSSLRGTGMCLFPTDKICLWKIELNVLLALKVNVWAKVNFVNGGALRSAWLHVARRQWQHC